MITEKELDRIRRLQKYCTLGVYNEQTDDFVEMFRTMQQAREYCEKRIKEHPNWYSTYGIHKWNTHTLNLPLRIILCIEHVQQLLSARDK